MKKIPLLFLILLHMTVAAQDREYIEGWINGRRAEAGLAPLQREAALGKSALGYSRELSERGLLSHRDREGRGPWERYGLAGGTALAAGEILGTSAAAHSLDEILDAWWESPSHREQILNPRWTCLGIGIGEEDRVRIVAVEFSSSLINEYRLVAGERGVLLEFTPLPGSGPMVLRNVLTGEKSLWRAGEEPVLNLGRDPYPLFWEIFPEEGDSPQWRGNRIVRHE